MEQSWNIWRIAFAKRKAARKVAAYNERQILSQVQYNSIKSKHGPFRRILHRGILSTKPYFFCCRCFWHGKKFVLTE